MGISTEYVDEVIIAVDLNLSVATTISGLVTSNPNIHGFTSVTAYDRLHEVDKAEIDAQLQAGIRLSFG